MTKIRVFSFEYDDCLAEKQITNSIQPNIITKNNELITNIRNDKHSYDRNIILIGSSRQSKAIDNKLALDNNNGSCFSNIKLLSYYIPAEFNPFLLEDIYYDRAHGVSINHPATLDDTHHSFYANKIAILYAQMHKISYENPANTILFHFFDGNKKSIEAISHYFALNANMIPRQITLELTEYKTPEVLRRFSLIQGQGQIDINYPMTTKKILLDTIAEPDPYSLQLSIDAEELASPVKTIISTPDKCDTEGGNAAAKFGYYEIIGHRNEQEDALAWQEMPSLNLNNLSPLDIGYRLWTTYKLLDSYYNHLGNSGTTASTTVYDGKASFITATLGDAASFAAIYDNNDILVAVIRLNSITHKPENPLEKKRIQDDNGVVVNVDDTWRVNGKTNISRGIGDHYIKGKYGEKLICSEASIDIIDITALAERCDMNREDISTIKLIITCDGFTDAAHFTQTKEAHEEFLFDCLQKYPKNISEQQLAKFLTQKALKKSWDNISVAIQTISPQSFFNNAVFLGVYDGHGGNKASHFVAKTVLPIFNEQCGLDNTCYMAQNSSVKTLQTLYTRDNPGTLYNPSSSSSSSSSFFSPNFFKPVSDFIMVEHSLLSQALQQEPSAESVCEGHETKQYLPS